MAPCHNESGIIKMIIETCEWVGHAAYRHSHKLKRKNAATMYSKRQRHLQRMHMLLLS